MSFGTASLLALARVSDDLVVGLAIGIMLGFLAGPLVRHLLAFREWEAASREARLTDELLARLPVPSADGVDQDEGADGPGATDLDDDAVPVRWRTSR